MTPGPTERHRMKTTQMTGARLREDNGSGYRLADDFPRRRFHGGVIYDVRYNGVAPDGSNIVSIRRSRRGWTQASLRRPGTRPAEQKGTE